MEDKEGSFAGHWHRAHGLFGSVPPIVGSDNQLGKFICLIFICFICATEVFGGGTVIEGGGCSPGRVRACTRDVGSVPSTDSRSAANKFHYLIISSARAKSVGGIVNPSALVVFRLMTSSNLMLCWTGRSAGLAPLRTFMV